MLDAALDGSGVVLGNSSFVDLGAAEGYAANHLFDRGAVDVDSCDLNKDGIERLWRIRAFTGRSFGRVGVLDLDHAGWAMELGRSYDVALALGVIYHLENPLLFARNLRHITRRIAIIESDTPVFPQNERFRGFGNLYLHRDQVRLRPGDDAHRFVTELRPDRQALVEILLTAGFARVQYIPSVKLGMSPYFDSGREDSPARFRRVTLDIRSRKAARGAGFCHQIGLNAVRVEP